MLKTNDQRKFLFCLTVPNCAQLCPLLFSTAIVFETEDIFYLLSKSSTLNKTHECMWATLLEVYGPCSRPVLGHEVYSVEANWANYLPPPSPHSPSSNIELPGWRDRMSQEDNYSCDEETEEDEELVGSVADSFVPWEQLQLGKFSTTSCSYRRCSEPTVSVWNIIITHKDSNNFLG